MKGEFIIKIGEELITYIDYDDIPNTFDHVIKFLPDVPHSEVDHDGPAGGIWNDRLQELIKREQNARSN